MLTDGNSQSIFGKKKLMIDEKEIKLISEQGMEVCTRESISHVKVYEDMILIYLSAVTAHIIPSRCLDEGSRKDLLEVFKANVQD